MNEMNIENVGNIAVNTEMNIEKHSIADAGIDIERHAAATEQSLIDNISAADSQAAGEVPGDSNKKHYTHLPSTVETEILELKKQEITQQLAREEKAKELVIAEQEEKLEQRNEFLIRAAIAAEEAKKAAEANDDKHKFESEENRVSFNPILKPGLASLAEALRRIIEKENGEFKVAGEKVRIQESAGKGSYVVSGNGSQIDLNISDSRISFDFTQEQQNAAFGIEAGNENRPALSPDNYNLPAPEEVPIPPVTNIDTAEPNSSFHPVPKPSANAVKDEELEQQAGSSILGAHNYPTVTFVPSKTKAEKGRFEKEPSYFEPNPPMPRQLLIEKAAKQQALFIALLSQFQGLIPDDATLYFKFDSRYHHAKLMEHRQEGVLYIYESGYNYNPRFYKEPTELACSFDELKKALFKDIFRENHGMGFH